MIHEIKYRQGHFLLPDLGRLSSVLFSNMAGGILVPVPLHWRRRWKRGFNQSKLICQALAREHGCSVRHLLWRRRCRRPQVGLTRADRRRNVEGVFALVPGVLWKNIAKDSPIYLVDDVLTTGATMNECAKVLTQAGFSNVHARTLARG
jgi:ComF family protein